MDEMQTRKCPVCGAGLEENESVCPFCGYTFVVDVAVESDASSAEEDEQFVLKVQEQVKEKTKVWKIIISIVYYLGVVGLIAAYCGFILNLTNVIDGESGNFGRHGLVYYDVFFVAVFGFLLVCMSLDALELNLIIKTLKESGADLKRFAKLSYARAEALQPKKCKDVSLWIDQRGSALNIAMFGKFKKTNDETRFSRLAMIAANAEIEQKFRKELWTRQIGFFLGVVLYVLAALLPHPLLSIFLMFVVSIGWFVLAILLFQMPKARVKLQAQWLKEIEEEENVQSEDGEESAQATDEFAEFDLSSYDL